MMKFFLKKDLILKQYLFTSKTFDMLKKADMVMLYSSKSKGLQLIGNKLSYYYLSSNVVPNTKGCDMQFLYFIDTEPVTETGWCINKNKDTLCFITTPIGTIHQDWFKVLATNNPELWEKSEYKKSELLEGWEKRVPKIELDFIEKYIKEYNSGTPIIEVMLEGDSYMPFDGVVAFEISLNPKDNTRFIPKLRNNGSVIVHPVDSKRYTWHQVETAFVYGLLNKRLTIKELQDEIPKYKPTLELLKKEFDNG